MGVSAAAIAVAIDLVRHGVDWSARDGGVCPACGKIRCKITRTMPWEGTTRTRYHRCEKCELRFKSLDPLRVA